MPVSAFMRASPLSLIASVLVLWVAPAGADTTITFTRSEIDQMANLWETDCLAVSPFADTQYPTYATSWQYIFPHSSVSGDGDIHIDMAVDSSGTGKTGNNTGASPIVSEVINATPAQLTALSSRNASRAVLVAHLFGQRHRSLRPAPAPPPSRNSSTLRCHDPRATDSRSVQL